MAIEVQKQFLSAIKAGLIVTCYYYQYLSIEVSLSLLIGNKEQRKYDDSAIILRTFVVMKLADDNTLFQIYNNI